jgi:hypothetical protein
MYPNIREFRKNLLDIFGIPFSRGGRLSVNCQGKFAKISLRGEQIRSQYDRYLALAFVIAGYN